jgi:hypothetical protein
MTYANVFTGIVPGRCLRVYLAPNARPELLPEAEARHERTLEAVSSRPWLGGAWECLERLHGGFPTVLARYHYRHAACGLLVGAMS